MCLLVFFFKQKTAYEMRISDWSSDVCSSDLFADDYLKLTTRSSDGLPGRLKLLIQVLICTAIALWISRIAPPAMDPHLAVPFFKGLLVDLGIFFITFAVFVMVGASNAVNLPSGTIGSVPCRDRVS